MPWIGLILFIGIALASDDDDEVLPDLRGETVIKCHDRFVHISNTVDHHKILKLVRIHCVRVLLIPEKPKKKK